MALKVNLKYGDTDIVSLTTVGLGAALTTADKLLEENIIAEVESNTEDATAVASDIIAGKTAYIADGSKATGTIQIYDWTTDNSVIKPGNLNPIENYTGSEITNGYTCPAHVTMTGQDRGTAIGTYTATYTPDSGYVWADDATSSAVTVTLSIINAALCFTANTANSTVTLSVIGTTTLSLNFLTSIDGMTWTTFTPGTTTITLTNINDKVYFRGNNPNGINESSSGWYNFVMSGSIAASGNIMSLIDNGSCTATTIPNNYCFYNLFKGCTSLTTPPLLPATTLTNYCYMNLFWECTSLTTPPFLPAATLAESCYMNMFYSCSSLIAAPVLPAMTATNECYYRMFGGCTALINPPALPATTLAQECYSNMFVGCTSLATAPVLPATTMVGGCYSLMFEGCIALTTAPELPATTLAIGCYGSMFWGCTSLTTVPKLSVTALAESCYSGMFRNCTSLYVSDTQTVAAQYIWKLPSEGVFTNTESQYYMFYNCAGTRSSDTMAGAANLSYTYYTLNTPV